MRGRRRPSTSRRSPGLRRPQATPGANGAQSQASFTIANADALFREGPSDTAFQDLAGPLPGSSLSARTFDWGLPFHYGRPVSVLFERRSAGTTTGPAVGF